MKKLEYLLMTVLASVFSVVWLYLCNVVDSLNETTELTKMVVFIVVAIGIALIFTQKRFKQKNMSASKTILCVVLTACLLFALMVGVFFLAIFILLSVGQ